ncbi:MAG: ABC transporter ATP-binding protein [Flavobacteriales bacterium]|nr:ABC transporter ATP-binding protein [Flavobacteriales bacterium]
MIEDYALRLRAVRFGYPGARQPVFQDFDLEIKRGTFLGLVGPNGAGKSTLILLMAGIKKPHQGEVQIRVQRRHAIGFVPQDAALFPTLNAWENLHFFSAAYQLSVQEARARIRQVLDRFGLAEAARQPVNTYSGGMKKRLNLAAAVLHDPEILLLDEPTAGIDVQSRKVVNDYLRELHERGCTLIYTSHHLRETEILCERIVILDNGRILEDASPAGLHQKFGAGKSLEDVFIQLTGSLPRD